MTTATGATLVSELRAIWARVPIPLGPWHPGSDAIRRVDADVRTALDVLAADEGAAASLAALVEGDRTRVNGSGAIGDAVAGLAALPRPDGKHPFLEDVMPGLEAAEAVLAAVALSPAATARYEAQRAPASTDTGS